MVSFSWFHSREEPKGLEKIFFFLISIKISFDLKVNLHVSTTQPYFKSIIVCRTPTTTGGSATPIKLEV